MRVPSRLFLSNVNRFTPRGTLMFNIHVGLVKKYFFHIFPIEAVAWTVIIEIIDGSFAKRDKSCLHWAIKFSLTLPCLFVNPVYLTVTHNIGRKCFVVDCSWQCTVTRHSCLFPKSKMKTSLKDEKNWYWKMTHPPIRKILHIA